jgi:hypothetical protein
MFARAGFIRQRCKSVLQRIFTSLADRLTGFVIHPERFHEYTDGELANALDD